MAIDFPTSPTIGTTYTYGNRSWIWTGVAWSANPTTAGFTLPEILPLDNLANQFDGYSNRFYPTYSGIPVTTTNQFRYLITINGVVQDIFTKDYVWDGLIPKDGFRLDDDGMIAFTENVPTGSTFTGRLLVGPNTTTVNTLYPFDPIDMLLGGFN